MDQWTFSLGQKVQRTNWPSTKDLHTEERQTANPISKIDDFVKHDFREHNQEADLWASTGAEGQRKIFVDKCNNSETWKAVKGHWDGSFKDNAKSGCGVVIKGVVRDRWVTISRSSESGYGYGSRSCRSVRAHRDPRSGVQQMSLCSECQSVYQQYSQQATIFNMWS